MQNCRQQSDRQFRKYLNIKYTFSSKYIDNLMDCMSNNFECSYLSVIIIDPHHAGEADLGRPVRGLPSHLAPPRPAQLISASEDKNIGQSQCPVSTCSVTMQCGLRWKTFKNLFFPLDIVFRG